MRCFIRRYATGASRRIRPSQDRLEVAIKNIDIDAVPFLRLRGEVQPKASWRCETNMDLSPGGIIAWIIVGLIAGWLTGLVMKGGGYGIVGDLIVGLIGALIGGFIVGLFIHGSGGLTRRSIRPLL